MKSLRSHRGEVRWIVRLWRPFAMYLAIIIAVTAVSTVVTVSLPLVLKRVFDGLAANLTGESLLGAVLLYLGLGSLDWLLATSLVFCRGTMNLRFEWAAREQAYARLIRQGPAFFQKFRTGDLVTRLTDDVSEKLSWFICSGIFRALAACGVIVFGVLMMLRLDPLLTLFTVGPLPLLILLLIRTGTVLDARFEAVQSKISALNAGLEACFSGIRVVKAYGREEEEERVFERAALECRHAEIQAARSQTLMNSLYGQVWQLGVVAVLLAGGAAVMSGRLTLGTFIAFDAYVLLLIFPMLDIGTFFVRGWQSGVSIGRLREIEEAGFEILESPASRTRGESAAGPLARTGRETRPDALPGVPSRGHLRFEGVSYAYPVNGSASSFEEAGREVLSDVSFEVAPGEMVAVVGRIGAGKTTLLRLIPRLMDPSRGRIIIDGADTRALPLAELRSTVGYVPQEAILFSDTIRGNIRFSRDEIDEARIERAARVARLARDLEGFSSGFETRVGVRGVSLSGGQKQRVALARALAGDPRILILDDATAALDAETEAALWEELHRVLPGMATLVVTHRCATLERADRIVVLDGGRVVETGTHAQLAQAGRVYRALYQRHRLEERVGEGESAERIPNAEGKPRGD